MLYAELISMEEMQMQTIHILPNFMPFDFFSMIKGNH